MSEEHVSDFRTRTRRGLDVELLRFLKERNATYGQARNALRIALSQLTDWSSAELWHLPMPDGINEDFNPDQVVLATTSMNPAADNR